MGEMNGLLINIAGTLAIIALFAVFVDLHELQNALASAKLEYLGLALAAYALVNLFMSIRIRYVLLKLGHDIGITSILRSNYSGMLLSDLTPARVGYFFTAISISEKHGVEIQKSILSILGPQLIEFMIKILCSIVLLLWMMKQFSILNGAEVLVGGSIVAAIVVVGFFTLLLIDKKLFERFAFCKNIPLVKKAYHLFRLMQENSGVLMKELPAIVLWTCLGWISKGLEWFLIANAVGIEIAEGIYGFFFFLLFHPFVTFIHFIPIPTLAGAGTGEAAIAAVLAIFGIGITASLAFGILARAVMLVLDLALGIWGVLGFARKKSYNELYRKISELENH